ncbi:CDP-glycerol--glycerophosphate glycerophosphotransferase [bacterium]|nr:CDP-glycerol--glycerophosphate glycerophosphotransferase [bacterium]MBT3795834.1 CDP-glycerol--glycerophosphate glycerophosphotransferase [bacterium]MBT4634369.1 CDP-glycerol--glycerophosphate glycerophosphotransferase [bacterium]
MRTFFKQLSQLISFTQLSKAEKSIVFYSEGKDSWIHLKGLIEEFLKTSKIHICYISSEENDPGLNLKDPKYKAFCIGSGYMRDWLFSNIQTNIMVMTMPDLNSFQLKQSSYNVHYVYLQHSLVSLHMAYRKGAFDYFQTIFCAGAHHVKELRRIEQIQNLKPKNLVQHGYSRLDQIIKETPRNLRITRSLKPIKHILIAPSWGENTIIDMIGEELVSILLTDGFKVTLRPHPQTIKLSWHKVEQILKKHEANSLFNLEVEMSSQVSLSESDLMVSDWSGAALDYAFGLNKPVLFIDLPKKVNNYDYNELEIEPLEVSIRSKIGGILALDELPNIATCINALLKSYDNQKLMQLSNDTVYNLGSADSVGVQALEELINNNV